jgi:dolichol kinase
MANGLMRPLGYYAILVFYFGWKIAYLFSAIGPELMLVDVLAMGWGDLDSALLGSAWGFVWADRSFSKNTVSAASVRP